MKHIQWLLVFTVAFVTTAITVAEVKLQLIDRLFPRFAGEGFAAGFAYGLAFLYFILPLIFIFEFIAVLILAKERKIAHALLTLPLTIVFLFLASFTVFPSKESIIIESPKMDSVISSPLVISGKADGFFFSSESTFPIILKDENGYVIEKTLATADGNWESGDLTPFRAKIEFSQSTVQTNKGTLEFVGQYNLNLPIRFK